MLLLVGGCKAAPSYDQSTPEAALESFFKALNESRLPQDLPKLVGEQEVKIWRMRCNSPGCAGGNFKIVARGDGNDVRRVLYVDYVITAENGVHIMTGNKSPLSFEKLGKSWIIVGFGRQLTAPPPKPAELSADDASPPQ